MARIPIQYALTYPARVPGVVPELDFTTLKLVTFDVADEETFRCLAACKKAIKKGGSGPAPPTVPTKSRQALPEDKIGFWTSAVWWRLWWTATASAATTRLADVYECDRMACAFVRSHLHAHL